MDLSKFFALTEGARTLPDGEPAEFVVLDLGELRVPSGRLALADTMALDHPLVVPVPAGTYRVKLTSAKVDEAYDLRGRREAYVSVVLSGTETVALEPADSEEGTHDWRNEPVGGLAGVAGLHGVGVGTIASVALIDREAIDSGMPGEPDTWYDAVIGADGGWFERMDVPGSDFNGTLNAELPEGRDGQNVVIVISRADLRFPVLATRDAAGDLTGIHIDLLVTGELAERLDAFEGPNELTQQLAAQEEYIAQKRRELTRKSGFFGRLFGRGR